MLKTWADLESTAKKLPRNVSFAMPSMLWEQKLHYLVLEYFEASGHVQTRPMQPETTCPDTAMQ